MSVCPMQQKCEVCGQVLIHKGSRSQHESASRIGQIIHDFLPPVFTFIDIDGALYRRSIRLLRILEHKSPGQHRKSAQFELLKKLTDMIEHIKTCPRAIEEFGLHQRSGVFLIESDPDDNGAIGPTKITQMHTGKSLSDLDALEFLAWIPLLKGKDKEFIQMKLAQLMSKRIP